jgi:uncharacterized protein (TIGR00730 family)
MSNEKPEPNGLSRKDIHERAIEEHLDRIQREFRMGFELLQKYPKSVTVFGSSMAAIDGGRYKRVYELAKRIVKDTGYTIISGGGPGLMEAAAKGATDAGGTSIGLRINLLRERHANQFTTDGVDFTYFFTRKTMLAFAAETYVYCWGGFGTMDELFSTLTLIQTNKIPRVPIVLFGSDFWTPFKEFITKSMLGNEHLIDAPDLDLFEITDDPARVVEIIKRAPVSEWWRNIN